MEASALVTVVIPVYCEAGTLASLVDALADEFETTDFDFEVVIVDDGSTDRTWDVLREIVERRSEVTGIRLSRRFGKEAALAAGLEAAGGDAVAIMDGDLQHPPSLLPVMLEVWKQGDAEVVEAVRARRGRESAMTRFSAEGFYALMSWLSGTNLRHSTDFKVLDRSVVERWRQLGERNLFFRGMVDWLGFETVQVPFEVPDRTKGESGWSFVSRLRLALTAVTSFSSFPLRLLTLGGLIFLALSALLGLQTLVRWLSGEALSGFTTVILLNLIIGGAVIFGLGVIGEYVARIYEEVKGRPRFVESERVGAQTPTALRHGDGSH